MEARCIKCADSQPLKYINVLSRPVKPVSQSIHRGTFELPTNTKHIQVYTVPAERNRRLVQTIVK